MAKKKGKAHKAKMAARKAKRQQQLSEGDAAAVEQAAFESQIHQSQVLADNMGQLTSLLQAGLDPKSRTNSSPEAGMQAFDAMLNRLNAVQALSSDSRPNLLKEAAAAHATNRAEAAEVVSGPAPAATGGAK